MRVERNICGSELDKKQRQLIHGFDLESWIQINETRLYVVTYYLDFDQENPMMTTISQKWGLLTIVEAHQHA